MRGDPRNIDRQTLIIAPADAAAGKAGGKPAGILAHIADDDALDTAFIKGAPLRTTAVCIICAACKLDLAALMDVSERRIIKAAARKVGGRQRTAVRAPDKVAVRRQNVDFSPVKGNRRYEWVFRVLFRRIGKAVNIHADIIKRKTCDMFILKNVNIRRKNLFFIGTARGNKVMISGSYDKFAVGERRKLRDEQRRRFLGHKAAVKKVAGNDDKVCFFGFGI